LVKTESSRNTYRGVDFNTTRFVPGGFSCTNSPSSCTWRKVLNGYTRNILVNPKIIFEFITLEHELLTEKHKAKTRAIGAAVKGAFRAFDPKPGGSKFINPLTNYSDLKKRQDLDQLVLQRVRVVRQSWIDLKNKGPK